MSARLGRRQYADDLRRNGSMTPEAAAAKAARDFAQLLAEEHLYRSLGFVETAVHMQKRLVTNP